MIDFILPQQFAALKLILMILAAIPIVMFVIEMLSDDKKTKGDK